MSKPIRIMLVITTVFAVIATCLVPVASAQQIIEPPDTVHFVIDTSWSMEGTPLDEAAQAVALGASKLDVSQVSGLRQYGGRCGSGGVLHVHPAPGAAGLISGSLGNLTSRGMTPTPSALRAAADDISGAPGRKVIVLVSDGESTCGDPCPVATEIKAAMGIDFSMVTVGFRTSSTANEELECIARVTGGKFVTVDDVTGLETALKGVVTGDTSGVDFTYYTPDPEPICINDPILISRARQIANIGASPVRLMQKGSITIDDNGLERIVVADDSCRSTEMPGRDFCLQKVTLGGVSDCLQTLGDVSPVAPPKPTYEDLSEVQAFGAPYTCPDVMFVGVRGSGQKLGPGRVDAAIWKSFEEQLPSHYNVEYRFLNYPADPAAKLAIGFRDSIRAGKDNLIIELNRTSYHCNTWFVLVGYSQGAIVIREALEDNWASRQLDHGVLRRIAGVALMSDPLRNPGFDNVEHFGGAFGSWRGNYNQLSPRKINGLAPTTGFRGSWCRGEDAVCSASISKGSQVSLWGSVPGTLLSGVGEFGSLLWNSHKGHVSAYDVDPIKTEAATKLATSILQLPKNPCKKDMHENLLDGIDVPRWTKCYPN